MVSLILNFLFKILPKKEFRLGKGCVTRYTVFEIRWLCSFYIHHIETFEQDRFHTHAFNAFVYILRGKYIDVIKDGIGKDKPTKEVTFKAGMFRYIPRLLNHKLTAADPGTVSLLLVGPYANLWTEENNDGTFRLLTKGRTSLIEFNENL